MTMNSDKVDDHDGGEVNVDVTEPIKSLQMKINKQAPKPRSYASPKLCPLTDSLTYLLTGVKCRATSVAKKRFYFRQLPHLK